MLTRRDSPPAGFGTLTVMNALLAYVASRGHLVRTTELIAEGFANPTIRRSLRSGEFDRICHGWVGTRDATQLSVIAAIHHGKLTGPTALATHGVWDGLDLRIHISVAPNSRAEPLPLKVPLSNFRRTNTNLIGIKRHWRRERSVDRYEPSWRASAIDALAVAARSLATDQFVACAESALATQLIPRAVLPALRAAVPRTMSGVVDSLRMDAGSGLESLFWFRMRPRVRALATQVRVPGLGQFGGDGFVDFVIDGWLAIETDGDAFHDPAVDRARNAFLVRNGYRWHRFGHHQVIHEWSSVEATVMELLRFPPGGKGGY